jgi:hypothetical protein
MRIPIAILCIIIIALVFVIYHYSKPKSHSSFALSFQPDLEKILNTSYKFPLIIDSNKLICSDEDDPKFKKLIVKLPIEIKDKKFYNVSLNMTSNNFILYDTKSDILKTNEYSICSMAGCVNTVIQQCLLDDIPLNVGRIINGTMPNWCESMMGLLEPVPNKMTGLEVVNWHRFKNFSIDLRKGKMYLTFNDRDIPKVLLPRVFQSKKAKNKMFPGDFYTIQVDSVIVENEKKSGPFYYILDVGTNRDLIPENLKVWLNYVGKNVSYKIGELSLNTNMNNLQFETNDLIDSDGTTLHAGLIGLNTMMGYKWFFMRDHIGISK